jgi:glutathione S-transferase
MAENTLSIYTMSVNNLSARILVRAAGLDFEEVDVWGLANTPEFLRKNPSHLTPMLEEDGLPRGSLWESCAIMRTSATSTASTASTRRTPASGR